MLTGIIKVATGRPSILGLQMVTAQEVDGYVHFKSSVHQYMHTPGLTQGKLKGRLHSEVYVELLDAVDYQGQQ